MRQSGWRLVVKRAIDVSASLVVLALTLPVIGATALVVRLAMGRPVMFRQVRPGKGGRPFTLLKFRTMSERRGPDGALLPDGERLTRVGRTIRSLALDELPQLVNVLRGEMSLVGPRPLRTEYLPLYSPEQARRHEVLPGITGWTQVNGRNALSWDRRLRLDVWYVDNWSLGLDIRILLVTPWRVLRKVGVTAPGHATMPDFTGNGEAPPAGPGTLANDRREMA